MGLCYNDRNSFNRFNISRNKGDKLMINGIKPNPMMGDFDKADKIRDKLLKMN